MYDLITINDDGQPATTSLKVAEKFEKEHFRVLRAIKDLECSPEFNAANFGGVEYTDAKGEQRPMYFMTKDGFTFLAMGFTGAKAAKFKEDFIRQFNAMDEQLRAKSAPNPAIDYDRLAEVVIKSVDQHISGNGRGRICEARR